MDTGAQWTVSVLFLTWVNFRVSPLPGERLDPILGRSDLTALKLRGIWPSLLGQFILPVDVNGLC